jgi:hypothetical protein
MRLAIVLLTTLALFVLLVAGSCEAWGVTSTETDAGFSALFIGLPIAFVGMALAVAAGICVVIDANKQNRGRWRTGALVVTLLGGLAPLVLLVGSFVALAASLSAGYNGSSLLIAVETVVFGIGLVGMVVLPALISLLALVYALTVKPAAQAARVAGIPYLYQPGISHPYAPGAPHPWAAYPPYSSAPSASAPGKLGASNLSLDEIPRSDPTRASSTSSD